MKPADAETALEREFDQHFELPTIRCVSRRAAFRVARARACETCGQNLVESLAYGTVVAIAGWLIWAYTQDRPQPFTASVTGFFLIAPLLAAGLYEISRRQEREHAYQLRRVAAGVAAQRRRARAFRTGDGACGRFSGSACPPSCLRCPTGEAPDLRSFFRDVFLSGNYPEVVIAYLTVGAVFAAIVFVVSAISIPMLLDRNGDIYTAMATSFLAVTRNIPAMLIWAR